MADIRSRHYPGLRQSTVGKNQLESPPTYIQGWDSYLVGEGGAIAHQMVKFVETDKGGNCQARTLPLGWQGNFPGSCWRKCCWTFWKAVGNHQEASRNPPLRVFFNSLEARWGACRTHQKATHRGKVSTGVLYWEGGRRQQSLGNQEDKPFPLQCASSALCWESIALCQLGKEKCLQDSVPGS